jgi:hypothetical protein
MKAPQRGIAPVWTHALLTGLALSTAYVTWTRDRTQVQSEWVVALDLNKRDISSLKYEDENRAVTVERRSGSDGEPYSWVTVSTHSKQLLTNPLGPPGAAPLPSPHGAPLPSPHGAAPLPSPHGAAPLPSPHGAAPPSPHAMPPAAPAPVAPAKTPTKVGDKAAGDKDHAAPPAAAPPLPAAAAVPPVPGPAAAPAPIHEVKDTITTRSFRGSDQADKLFEQFAPMRVVRALGTVSDQKAKELGLDASKKSLIVIAKGQQTKFMLGSNSYGSGDVYARDPQNQVYLLSSRAVSDFEFAESRLMERRLHRFERPDFDRLEVELKLASGSKTRTLLQKSRQDTANFYFSDAATPEKRDDSLRNWVDKVLRLAINDYVAEGEEPKPSPPVAGAPLNGEIVSLRFFDGRKQIGEASLSRYPNKSGQIEYFAHTETTIGQVRLLTATAESAVQDAEKW